MACDFTGMCQPGVFSNRGEDLWMLGSWLFCSRSRKGGAEPFRQAGPDKPSLLSTSLLYHNSSSSSGGDGSVGSVGGGASQASSTKQQKNNKKKQQAEDEDEEEPGDGEEESEAEDKEENKHNLQQRAEHGSDALFAGHVAPM